MTSKTRQFFACATGGLIREFTSRAELMDAMAPLDAKGRAEILYRNGNRDMVLNSGASVTLHNGMPGPGGSFKEQLAPVHLALVRRSNPWVTKDDGTHPPDGVGALGGLSERTPLTSAQFKRLKDEERENAASSKDDIFGTKNHRELSQSLKFISRRTVAREMGEELGELGIAANIDLSAMKRVNLRGIRDDNYILRVWKPERQKAETIFAVTPFCYSMTLDDKNFAALTAPKDNNGGKEVLDVTAVPLFDALSRFGKPSGLGPALENGRSATSDYRYPHEWVASWAIASDMLSHDPQRLIALASEVQAETKTHRIDFPAVAKIMGVELKAIDAALSVPHGTTAKMQAAMDRAFAPKAPKNTP